MLRGTFAVESLLSDLDQHNAQQLVALHMEHKKAPLPGLGKRRVRKSKVSSIVFATRSQYTAEKALTTSSVKGLV